MMQQPALAHIRAANDNIAAARRPLRTGAPRMLAIPGSVLVLMALSAMFLAGLIVVGLLAPVLGGIDLLHKRLPQPRERPLLTAK